jgi:hypothetical protein
MKKGTKNLLLIGALGLGALYILPKMTQSAAQGATEGAVGGIATGASDMSAGLLEGLWGAYNAAVGALWAITPFGIAGQAATSIISGAMGGSIAPTTSAAQAASIQIPSTIWEAGSFNQAAGASAIRQMDTNLARAVASGSYSSTPSARVASVASGRVPAVVAYYSGAGGSGRVPAPAPTRPITVNSASWASRNLR